MDRHRHALSRHSFSGGGKHGGGEREEHKARNSHPQALACARLPLPSASKRPPRHAQHRAAEIQNRHLHQRLFLAPTRKLQTRGPALDAPRLLASKTHRQQRARRTQHHCPPIPRLHRPHHLGMRDKVHPRHPHHPQPPAKGSSQPCPQLLTPPRHHPHGSCRGTPLIAPLTNVFTVPIAKFYTQAR